jgi:hypothetical protein
MGVPAARMGCAVQGVPAALNSAMYWVISMITSSSESKARSAGGGGKTGMAGRGEQVHLPEQVQQRLPPRRELAAGVVEPGAEQVGHAQHLADVAAYAVRVRLDPGLVGVPRLGEVDRGEDGCSGGGAVPVQGHDRELRGRVGSAASTPPLVTLTIGWRSRAARSYVVQAK